MAIDSLRDGFVRLCFDPSLNVLGDQCRMVLEGQYLTTDTQPATADTLVKVTSVRDIDAMFGTGSVLSESLKKAISCCTNDAVEIFALPRADPAGAVQAVYTMTITGTATSDGRIDIYWGDAKWNISRRVQTGDTPTAIAADIVANMPVDFPYTATATAGAITLTARNGGTVGNFLNPQVNWHGRNNYMPEGVSVATVQTTPGTGDLTALNYASVFGECCVCCWAALGEGDAFQEGVVAKLEADWACDKPQCFGHAYTYNSGSLGQILATDTNSAVLSRMAHCTTDPNFPWLKVAAYTAVSCCLTVDNPEISIQGQFGVLSCISAPETCSACFTFDEQEQLRESGFVVTVPVAGGQGALTSPVVTNDITNNRYDAEGRENLTFRDVSSRRLAAKTADEFAKHLQQFNGLGLYTKRTDIKAGVLGTNPRLMLGSIRAWAKDNVGVLFSEFDDIDRDITVRTDFEVAPACRGIPGKLYVDMVYRPPVRVGEIVVNLKPKLLDNC